MQNLASPLHTTTLVESCTQLLVDQWLYMRANVSLCSVARAYDVVLQLRFGSLCTSCCKNEHPDC